MPPLYTIDEKKQLITKMDKLSDSAFGKDIIRLPSNIFLLFLISRIRAEVARQFVKMVARVTPSTKTRATSVCAVVSIKDLAAKVNSWFSF